MSHRLKFFFPVLQSTFQICHHSPGIFDVHSQVFARFQIVFEFDPAIGPKRNFLAQSLVHRRQCFVDMGHSAIGDFSKMFGDQGVGG